jgi:hypothetical protein
MSSLVERGIIAQGTLPAEYFDLIAGTSTGVRKNTKLDLYPCSTLITSLTRIIAILLGRLHLSVDECIELYKNLGGEIFGKAKPLNTGTMFSASKLEQVIRRIVAERTGLESQLLQEYYEAQSCPV